MNKTDLDLGVWFTLRNLMGERITKGLLTHLVFVDLQKVYDTVLQNKLWTSMIWNCVSETYIEAA